MRREITNEQKVLDAMASGLTMSSEHIAIRIGLPLASARRTIGALVAEGKLVKTTDGNSKKGTKYRKAT